MKGFLKSEVAAPFRHASQSRARGSIWLKPNISRIYGAFGSDIEFSKPRRTKV